MTHPDFPNQYTSPADVQARVLVIAARRSIPITAEHAARLAQIVWSKKWPTANQRRMETLILIAVQSYAAGITTATTEGAI